MSLKQQDTSRMCEDFLHEFDPNPCSSDSREFIKKTLIEFLKGRDWDQYQSPKNLSMAFSLKRTGNSVI